MIRYLLGPKINPHPAVSHTGNQPIACLPSIHVGHREDQTERRKDSSDADKVHPSCTQGISIGSTLVRFSRQRPKSFRTSHHNICEMRCQHNKKRMFFARFSVYAVLYTQYSSYGTVLYRSIMQSYADTRSSAFDSSRCFR